MAGDVKLYNEFNLFVRVVVSVCLRYNFLCLQQKRMAGDVKLYNEIILLIVSVVVSVCLQYSLSVTVVDDGGCEALP